MSEDARLPTTLRTRGRSPYPDLAQSALSLDDCQTRTSRPLYAMNSYRLSTILLLLPAVAAAQSRWKEIGKTSGGNSVYVDPRSVKKVNGIVTARVRVKFETPVKTPQGLWATSQSLAMFDCAKSTIAAKETIYYADEKAGKITERKVNAQPGYGPALGGSMAKVALDYLCAPPK